MLVGRTWGNDRLGQALAFLSSSSDDTFCVTVVIAGHIAHPMKGDVGVSGVCVGRGAPRGLNGSVDRNRAWGEWRPWWELGRDARSNWVSVGIRFAHPAC
jgi:hypothetical protein